MARKGWDALKASYRERLEKAGYTREQYDSGVPLKDYRGHKNTPERPASYDPTKFPKYNKERAQLYARVEARKEKLFGDSPRWNKQRSDRAIRERPPSFALMRWALRVSDEELLRAVKEDPDTYRFLTYG